ncbi:hypothetical protein [Pandoravirus japonicus]|uniref:Uncharacterized protein n=1 Tax=Pandoravirus japonicus TaxID=2823154 RepID=A0A811BQA8_9VIRU|nr:hypothetical protein [Pandoravirus japonicus]
MWKPVGSCVPRLAAASRGEVMAAATHSVALTVPMAGRARLLVTALYRPLETGDKESDMAADPPPVHTWWPADIDQWLAVASALRASAAREIGCGDAASRHLARPPAALARLYEAAGWNMGRAGGRLVALAAEVCDGDTASPPERARDDADGVHIIHAGRLGPGTPAAEWRAFCRLVAQRDAVLRRALDVDSAVYGARGSFVVTSMLRAEEALGRRWRFDPALPDPDATASLRRAFMAVADARQRTARVGV